MSINLREILKGIVRVIGYEFNKSTIESEDRHVDQAEAQIRSLMHERVPEKKAILSSGDFNNLNDFEYAMKTGEHIGHNKAIDLMHQRIDKEI